MINNDFYNKLGEKWYLSTDHPIALLRAENRARIPWVISEIRKRLGNHKVNVLDVGCGAGFLTNALALEKHHVTGVDVSQSSLEIAKKYDQTQSVKYQFGNAYALPFEQDEFDVVCAMDILEHIDHPERLIHEASRILRPGGLFFFHTFNRNLLSNLVIIKGVEWFIPNTPANMHVYNLFITPEELKKMCKKEQMHVEVLRGFMPCIWDRSFWKMLVTRKISDDISFQFTRRLTMGYCGLAIKE